MDRTLIKMKRRLEREELVHLRQHCAELAERLEKAEDDLRYSLECYDFSADWARELMEAHPEVQIGITRDGQIGLVVADAAAAQSAEGASA
jgi:Tat protein secretion system quality control protein TatD with DNase activity